MMNSTAHLGDAELLRLGDAEVDAREGAAWQQHLTACEECSARAATLHADETLFRDALASDAPAAAPASRPSFDEILRRRTSPASGPRAVRAHAASTPWLRAAAILIMVAAPVAAVPALRDWVVSGMRGRSEVPVPAAAPELRSAASAGGSIVRFVPSADNIVVQLDAFQAGGVLQISSSGAEEASLAVTGLTDEVPVYSEHGLRIRNSASSTASYTLQVPATIRSVRVTAGGRTLGTFDVAAIRGGVDVALRP